MPKTIHLAGSRWFWTFALVSSLVLPALELGAQTAQPTPIPAPKAKVKVVEVIKSGTSLRVDPDRVKLKRREEIVVWVTNGQALKIAFKKANPFTDLVCKGRFCAALTPPDVLGIFDYKVTVDGVVLDPNVEVVP
jgi:hypothetical protein